MKHLFILFFITACIPTFIGHLKEADYTSDPLIELPAGKLFIVSETNNDNSLDQSVNKKLKNWALIRLRPNYQSKEIAIFNIKKSDIQIIDIPKKYFWHLEHKKYILSFNVELIIKNDNSETFRAISWGEITQVLPTSSSPLEKENFISQMIQKMESEIEKKLTNRLRNI